MPFPSWSALASLLALAVVCTALTFMLYYWLMEQASATSLSMIAYLAPLVAVILGVTILGEQLGWNAYLGCGLILLGVMAVNGLFQAGDPRQLRSATVRS